MFMKLILQIVIIFLLVNTAIAKDKYTDPDSPEVEAAARKALPKAVIKDIIGTSREIVGVSRGIEGILNELSAKVSEHEIKIELSADVLFDFDKYDIRSDAAENLRKVAEVIKAYPKTPILIEGHTDSRGSEQYNLKLSEQRALSVKNWMVKNGGVEQSRISTKGWGAVRPVAPNTNPDRSDNPAGRQKNRRVEITIRK